MDVSVLTEYRRLDFLIDVSVIVYGSFYSHTRYRSSSIILTDVFLQKSSFFKINKNNEKINAFLSMPGQ